MRVRMHVCVLWRAAPRDRPREAVGGEKTRTQIWIVAIANCSFDELSLPSLSRISLLTLTPRQHSSFSVGIIHKWGLCLGGHATSRIGSLRLNTSF